MTGLRLITSIIREYGVGWAFNRTLYAAKLKLLHIVPRTERFFEERVPYPMRIDVFQIDTGSLSKFLRSLPGSDQSMLVSTADKACNGVIQGFSSIPLDYGNPIDWQLNPLTGKRCDEKRKWFDIPDFDKDRGDIKTIWEASRFSHFITLARAYLLTGTKNYYESFSKQLDSWLLFNPYGFGANFKCGQECALRMVNALFALAVFKGCGIAAEKDERNVKELLDRCYRKIRSNFFYAYRCIKNNHTISELMGMIIGAWCCGDEKNLSKAYRLLDEVIDEQFFEDGGYCQFSFNYQRMALQDLECILAIERTIEKSLSARSKEKIRTAALLMYQCQDKSGDMPNYGSNDGALIFPMSSCGYRDFRPTINAVYALITGKQLYEAGKHQEELIWFANKKALESCTREHIDRVDSSFYEAGLFSFRQESSWAMLVLNDYKSRPAHMDQLHFDLWVDGINVLCDAGTYSYAASDGYELVKNKSHNTVLYDDRDQMNKQGAFFIYGWTRRKESHHESNRFRGEMLSQNGYAHRRTVEVTESGYRIIDEVAGDDLFKVIFHTPCEVETVNGELFLNFQGKRLCKVSSESSCSIRDSFRSLFYLRKEKISSISFLGNAKGTGHTVITDIEIIGRGTR